MNRENDNDSLKIREFTDLKVWQESHRLVLFIYEETANFPREEIFGLTSQMRRAVVSISSNIAEGFGRKSYKEKIQFYFLSLGSLYELRNQIIVARDVKYISGKSFDKLQEQSMNVQRLLHAFINKSKSFL